MGGSPEKLTHYYRPFSRPLLCLSALPEARVGSTLAALERCEPLPYRLTQPRYLPERHRIEHEMRTRFAEKGGAVARRHPHYFVLGEFSLWESDGSCKVELPFADLDLASTSFTLTDSFFNYRRRSLHGEPIPPRRYHDELFRADELPALLEEFDLPTEHWSDDPGRKFEVYVEAQLWSDEPVARWLGESRGS